MILIIDTSSSGIGLVLGSGAEHAEGGLVKHIATEKQTLDLPHAVEKFLHENGADWRDLTAIGVVVGPGSFTGIRLGIAYAKGIAMGLNPSPRGGAEAGIPVISINAFEIYLQKTPDAFVAIDSNKGDFFCASKNHAPCVMTIDEVESEQMKCPQTVGHEPFDLTGALPIVQRKLSANSNEPVIPMYLKPSYAERNCQSS